MLCLSFHVKVVLQVVQKGEEYQKLNDVSNSSLRVMRDLYFTHKADPPRRYLGHATSHMVFPRIAQRNVVSCRRSATV